ncbi:autophagocytosis associated protein [Blastocladiella britannica]|nr:autophagocytosis associated protein [Blastocladiella britannica]
MSNITSVFMGIREYWTPVLAESRFLTHAVLTPEEFVAAGDFLVFKCGTWRWDAGDPSKRKDYLPADKQFLTTKNVPCLKRVREMEYRDSEMTVDGELGDDGWLATHIQDPNATAAGDASEESDLDMLDDVAAEFVEKLTVEGSPTKKTVPPPKPKPEAAPAPAPSSSAIPDMDIPDMDDMDDMAGGVEEADDPSAVRTSSSTATTKSPGQSGSSSIVRTRTYDLSITYDKYYQTPRLSLLGYDEQRRPLPPAAMLMDISQDHANKTVTIEAHTHLNGVQVASIHPCRHAEVMLRIMGKMREAGREVRVDQYLIVFLKFMASVIPTIDYDHTMALE